jgi:WD40 repeat protein
VCKFSSLRRRDGTELKQVNFLGPDDEYVVSGSDDGNVFIWNKAVGVLHDLFEGDGSVVNVIEGHPYLPLVAVSGFDTTVKVSFFFICVRIYAIICCIAVRTSQWP